MLSQSGHEPIKLRLLDADAAPTEAPNRNLAIPHVEFELPHGNAEGRSGLRLRTDPKTS